MRRSSVRLAEIDTAIEEIIIDLERSDVEVDWSDGGAVYCRLKDWLDANRGDDMLHILTQKEMQRFDKARRPDERRNEQGTLFQPDALLPLGSGRRVRMGKAQRVHLEQWLGILDDEHNASVAAYRRTRSYIEARLSEFTGSDEELIDVERRCFGYIAENSHVAEGALAP